MFRTKIKVLLVVVACASAAPSASLMAQQNEYDLLWSEVDSLDAEGLARSARDKAIDILALAREEADEDQLLKALLYRARYIAQLEEDEINQVVRSLRSEIPRLSPVSRAVLQSVLAGVYWQYYQARRWHLMDRGTVAGEAGVDIATWDARRLIAEAVELLTSSLQERELLASQPIGSYAALLEGPQDDRYLQPTVFDFLARRAVEILRSTEIGLPDPIETFDFTNSAFLAPASDFAALSLASPDTLSPEFLVMRIYQSLIRLHLHDPKPDVLVSVDLDRLAYVKDSGAVPGRRQLYIEQLRSMEDMFASHPVGTEVSYALATALVQIGNEYRPFGDAETRWKLKEAHDLCTAAIKRFPKSFGASNCGALNASVESKQAEVQIERTVQPGTPYRVRVDYRNVDRLYVAVVRMTEAEARNRPFYRSEERRKLESDLLQRERVVEEAIDLVAESDFQTHSTEVALSALPPGLYALIAGSDPTFKTENHARAIVPFAASRLAVIERNQPDGTHEIRVVDRDTGRPIEGAVVTTYTVDYAAGNRFMNRVGDTKTASDGRALPTTRVNQPFTLTITKDHDKLVGISSRYSYRHGAGQQDVSYVSHFFTDRAIYRPAQTIHFKGILLSKNGDRHAVRANQTTVVELVDPNGRVLSSHELTSNEYGTIKGRFQAPTGAGTGAMTIRDSHGAASVRIEEYKRPRFEVSFDTLAAEVEVGDSVRVTGNARAFSGAPVDGAVVRYRVVRTPLMHPWSYWRFGPMQWTEAEIAVGSAVTDGDGSFHVAFVAAPDQQADPEANPRFVYRVTADVTDLAGETRSGNTSVTVGYASIVLDIGVVEQLMLEEPQPVRITAENLNGSRVAVDVRVVVERLQPPGRLLRSRPWERVDRPLMSREEFVRLFPLDVYDREDDPVVWEIDGIVFDEQVSTATTAGIETTAIHKWKPGKYRIKANATDSRGRDVRAERIITVFAAAAPKPPYPTLDWFVPVKAAGEPGEAARLLVGTSATDAHVFVETERAARVSATRVLKVSNGQRLLEFGITAGDRGNFAVHVTFVRFGRLHTHTQVVEVPYTDRELTLRLETFRDLLYPGEEEEWRVRITGSEGEPVVAELMASLYDASLDQFVRHDWYFNPLHHRSALLGWRAAEWWNTHEYALGGHWNRGRSYRQRRFERLNLFGLNRFLASPRFDGFFNRAAGVPDAVMEMSDDTPMKQTAVEEGEPTSQGRGGDPEVPDPPTESAGAVRTNFEETAFFFPDLETDADGVVTLKFTIPEALTRWRFLGLAHTPDVRFGQVTAATETRKNLMIIANAPRFLRSGDTLQFAASVQNLSDSVVSGTARLAFYDASTMVPMDEAFSNASPSTGFEIEPGRSAGLKWSISVPDGIEMVVYRVTANAADHTDGEQKTLPVLTDRMLVTESLPLPMRGPGTKQFTFQKLKDNASPTLRHHGFSLEFTPNPVWYAVQALPYMMEFPHECSEQIFSRLYANSIAAHIVQQNPRIQQVFGQWRDIDAGALQSNLEKNAELKALVIEETPWLQAAQDESERKRRIGVLFDFSRMAVEQQRASQQLVDQQYATGAWPWFAGMPPNRYVTQHIVSGFGHLRKLGINEPASNNQLTAAIASALSFLDAQIKDDYDRLVASGVDLEKRHLGWTQIHYLYARSFFPERAIPQQVRHAFDYYLKQAREFWLDNSFYGRGMIALALHRLGDTDVPSKVLTSLRELALQSEELGMYWKYDAGYYWYQAPIETQALLIEAFDEIANDRRSVADMQLWLLKHKQTQDWKTTKATTEAVYALLMRGTDLISDSGSATVRAGSKFIESDDERFAEPGTGYMHASWGADEVTSELASIEVSKSGPGPAWGAAYWQYFEDLDRITSAETPLRIDKQLFVETATDSGPVLREIDNKAPFVGDKLIVQVTIRVDRDMEYVHLKDMRGSGLEPVNVLSGYKYRGGLGYYESTRDAATHFFIGYLPKGTYVFEYPLRANLSGNFSNGITIMQSMYAPEFASHSAGRRVAVGPQASQ